MKVAVLFLTSFCVSFQCLAFVHRPYSFVQDQRTSWQISKVPHVPHQRKGSAVRMSWFQGLKPSKESKRPSDTAKLICILDHIGSGSYGTVHQATFCDDQDDKVFIAKRAWTEDELRARPKKTHREDDPPDISEKALKDRAARCRYYLDVEQHCLGKVTSLDEKNEVKVPKLIGKYKDNSDGHEWLLFQKVMRSKDDLRIARSLKSIMDLDWIDQHEADRGMISERHHLYLIHKELGMGETATFEDTLDSIFKGLLKSIVSVHGMNLAHRDIKPDNILVTADNEEFVIIDFGSCQDVDIMKKMVFTSLIDGEASVAISPVYSAPECFIEWDKSPLNFDVFSIGLVFCQLLFNFLDDRTDAGFRQQLEDADYDLDLWLERELQATLRPAGIEDGLEYLGSKPGLWGVLRRMLQRDPKKRISSKDAKKAVDDILTNDLATVADRVEKDGAYFDLVIKDLDICTLPPEFSISAEEVQKRGSGGNSAISPRPLHYVATFERSESIGLILSEADEGDEGEWEQEDLWRKATVGALAGDLFIRDIISDGQADTIGIFEIGDRVAAVMDFPLEGGFEGFVSMLGAVPQNSKTVKVHFDRRAEISNKKIADTTKSRSEEVRIASHGAFSVKGRRKTQEDTFVLHEIQSGSNTVLLSGIFDGHGGDNASKSVSQLLPRLLASELKSQKQDQMILTLDTAWDEVCDSYREGCSLFGSGCVADYDAREGILYASTGSKELFAGSTATVSTICLNTEGSISELIVLNCGDSRTLVAGQPQTSAAGAGDDSFVYFVTRDHVPSCPQEAKRLLANPNFATPQCSMNKYWLKIGDYRYALSRSLEGPLATSQGITNESDLYTIDVADVAATRANSMIIQASDGLFEVLDNEEVARDAVNMRKDNLSAKECAQVLCQKAIKKGSSDNVSVVVIFFE